MKTIGFPISRKENELRRALIPADIERIQNRDKLYFEIGYGEVLGYSDNDYKKLGCHVVSRQCVLKQDIICDPKIGDAEYLIHLENGQTAFGWIHAVQNFEITEKFITKRISAIAWEDMYKFGRHVFWRNNEVAGEAAIMHAFQCMGIMPYGLKVALLGRGNVANGALKILTLLGADVTVYSRKMENLFRMEMNQYDVIVNAILWDITRKDHIVNKEDLSFLKKNAFIIDISCDKNGAIETSVPTTIDRPVYYINGIAHYVVDHTPSLFYRTATESISCEVSKYIDEMIEEKKNEVIENAVAILNGHIIDKRIIEFQGRNR